MKKLDIFLVKSYLGPFVLTFFISLFVLLMQFLWKYVDDFVGKGFGLDVIGELMFYASATFVPMALPLAVLLSSLMLFGNLGENYELAAIKSAGISLSRVMRPLAIAVFILSLFAFGFSNYVLPVSNLKFRTLLRDVRQKKPAVQIEAGVFYDKIDNYVIKIGAKDPDGITIRDVLIYDHSASNGNTNVTTAKSGRMEMSSNQKYLIFTLFNGYNYDENIRKNSRFGYTTHPLQKTRFHKQIVRIDLSSFDFKKGDGSIFRNNYEMMNIAQLEHNRDSLMAYRDSVLRDFRNYTVKDYNFLSVYKKARIERDSLKEQGVDNHVDTLRPSSKAGVDSLKKIRSARLHNPLMGLKDKTQQKKKKASPAKALTVLKKWDTTAVFNDTLYLNFSSADADRILSSAITMARNANYHSDIIAKNDRAKREFIAKHDIQWHRKWVLSLACLLFFFVGAPLGAIIRKGGLGTPLVLSILLFVTYYVFAIIGEKSAKQLVMSPFMGMWLATFVFLPLSIYLTRKATVDAPILDREAYLKVYNKALSYLPFVKKWIKRRKSDNL